MKTEFVGFSLRTTLLQALEELDHLQPTPIQEAVIPSMLEGKDVIAQAKTGTGKTAAFALPVLQNLKDNRRHTQVLVLSPTRELAKQVGRAFSDYAKHEQVNVLTIYGGASYGYQKGTLKKGVDIVVGTPGRLLDLLKQGNLKLDKLHTLVLDEADEMLSLGFAEELEELLTYLPEQRQTALFSATLPAGIQKLARQATRDPVRVNLSEELSTRTVSLAAYTVRESDKVAAITRLFEMEQITSALVFCRTRAQTSVLAAELTRRGIPAEALSGALEQGSREMVLRRFRDETFTVLVATDVAARGLDIEHLSHVVNCDLPQSPETFVHRIGRVGRAGRQGVAYTLVTPKEEWKLKRIEGALKRSIERRKVPSAKEIRRQRLDHLFGKMTKWLESDRCKKELAWVEELQQAGYDAKTIAAAALKLASASEKERPIAEMNEELPQEKKTRGPRSAPRKGEAVQLMADIGKKHGLRTREMVAVLGKVAGIPGSDIGSVRITKTRCFVDVGKPSVNRVLKKNGAYQIGKRRFTFRKAT